MLVLDARHSGLGVAETIGPLVNMHIDHAPGRVLTLTRRNDAAREPTLGVFVCVIDGLELAHGLDHITTRLAHFDSCKLFIRCNLGVVLAELLAVFASHNILALLFANDIEAVVLVVGLMSAAERFTRFSLLCLERRRQRLARVARERVTRVTRRLFRL